MGCSCSTSHEALAASTPTSKDLMIVVKCVEAKLSKNFDDEGKMDPFARLTWIAQDGAKWEFSVTKTDKGGHFTPVWNSLCEPHLIDEACLTASVQVEVLEEDEDCAEHCGVVVVPFAELLKLPRSRQNKTTVIECSHAQAYELKHIGDQQPVGHVYLQVLVAPSDRIHEIAHLEAQTEVDPSLFQSPVKRLGVSGGTAPFFHLLSKDNDRYWIGKDLSHALDEVGFYEELLSIRRRGSDLFGQLVNFTFDYKGVVALRDADSPDEAPARRLLVLRNLFHNMKRLRLVDIKMGEVTAHAGWQGKSKLSALRQGLLDGMTNSAAEGFRLEGFDGEPVSLSSQDPLLDLRSALLDIGGSKSKKKTAKKARRLMLQRMNAQEMLYYFSDVHVVEQWTADPNSSDHKELLETNLSPSEAMEMIMAELTDQLVRLAVACKCLSVPQKWIGSSVALGFDAEHIYPRGTTQADIRNTIHCKVFDWGRSELLTSERFMELSPDQKTDRTKFWRFYCSGIERLSFEMSAAYNRRFDDRVRSWKEVVVTVMDYDSLSAHDFLGRVTIPLEETKETSVPLLNSSGNKVSSATITYWISKHTFPTKSAFQEAWYIHIVKAGVLPASPRNPDAFVILKPVAEGTETFFQQQSRTITDDSNPVWKETFEIPVLKENVCSRHAFLNSISTKDPKTTIEALRQMAASTGNSAQADASLTKWRQLLSSVAASQDPLGVAPVEKPQVDGPAVTNGDPTVKVADVGPQDPQEKLSVCV